MLESSQRMLTPPSVVVGTVGLLRSCMMSTSQICRASLTIKKDLRTRNRWCKYPVRGSRVLPARTPSVPSQGAHHPVAGCHLFKRTLVQPGSHTERGTVRYVC